MPIEQQKTIDVKALEDKINFHPHPMQEAILNAFLAGKKRIIVASGQRVGKSAIASLICLISLMSDNQEILVISPSYALTDRIFEYLRKWLAIFFNQPVNYVSKPFPRITMPWNSYVEGKSAQEVQQLLGKSYSLIIADESARIPREVFEQYLIPRLGEKQGVLCAISTPWKRDHFFEMFMAAKQEGSAFQFPTSANPFYPKEEIEKFRKQLPAAIFKREFEGVFSDEMTSIFPNAFECVSPDLPRKKHQGVFSWVGLDLAREEDFTCLTIGDSHTQEIIFCERWQKLPYQAQVAKVCGILAEYQPCRVVVDALNVGAVLGDELRAKGLNVEDWIATGTTSKDFAKRGSKELMVEKLMSLFESHSITIPNNPDLLDELSSYSYVISPSGNIKYGNLPPLHDDMVSSLMMCCWNMEINPTISKKEREFKLQQYNEEYNRKPKYFYPEIENPNYGNPGSPSNNPPSIFGPAPKVW